MKSVLLDYTDKSLCKKDVVQFFVRRWQMDVSFARVSRHLGVKTQHL
jgi:hypothetical protein